MQELKSGNETDNLEDRISLAMDKIVQETIGDIAVSEQIDQPSPKKKNILGRVILSLAGIAILAGAGFYGYKTYYYRDKFFQIRRLTISSAVI